MPEQHDLLLEALKQDLATLSMGSTAQYLIFSGDFVHGGSAAQDYEGLATRLEDRFTDLGLDKTRRIIVPGNHDISREHISSKLFVRNSALDAIEAESTFLAQLPTFASDFIEPAFVPYRAFESRFAKYTSCHTNIGGTGWSLSDSLGAYCLNSALCSSAGLSHTSTARSDFRRLHIDTRSLYRWLDESSHSHRILVMHHPPSWLAPWAQKELDTIISTYFDLVLHGHVHDQHALHSHNGTSGFVTCAAPALFTHKDDHSLGYAIITLDDVADLVDIHYRHWTTQRTFVQGAALSKTDDGIVQLPLSNQRSSCLTMVQGPSAALDVLEEDFNDALLCYSSKRVHWVDRDLVSVPESKHTLTDSVSITALQLATEPRNCVVRAPKQFGLSSLGRYVALEHYKNTAGNTVLVMLDSQEHPAHGHACEKAINAKCATLGVSPEILGGLVLDNYRSDEHGRRQLRELRSLYPSIPFILLETTSLAADFSPLPDELGADTAEVWYLWSLSRNRVRALARSYISTIDHLSEDAVTDKLVSDIDAINSHRTPVNCLLLLRLFEREFDDTPVNRTALIGSVLSLLFQQHSPIPSYASRPDVKDCEFVMGRFCEWLIRDKRSEFSRSEFYTVVDDVSRLQKLEIDREFLFNFLFSESIIVRSGSNYRFRMTYWAHYFAAHRMHHSTEFAEYIYNDSLYTQFPEIIEFYTGIDRRRSDAIKRAHADLIGLDAEFEARTQIQSSFDPFKDAQWAPDKAAVHRLRKAVAEGAEATSLSRDLKDAIADRGYDRGKPYIQEIERFLDDSSLQRLMNATSAAARALRNSDWVDPSERFALLAQVISSWVRMCQVLALLSPVLAQHGRAYFDNTRFVLIRTGDEDPESVEQEIPWEAVFTSVPDNVVTWFQEDVFSRKLGPLFSQYCEEYPGTAGEILILLVLIRQRPSNWTSTLERFVRKCPKNSFNLYAVFRAVRSELRYGFPDERSRQDLKKIAAMAIARHDGSKEVGVKTTRKVLKQLEEDGSLDPKETKG